MVNVDTVYQRVLALANKEQRGYITPQEFNLFANQAQMDIFEQYFYDLNQFKRIPGNDINYTDVISIIEEKLTHFKSGPVSISSGDNIHNTLPNFYRLTDLNYQGKIVEEIKYEDYYKTQAGPLTKATTSRPIYWRKNAVIYFEPYDNDISAHYIRKPHKANWTYIVIGEKALYNDNAIDRQNFELHPSEETKLVIKILQLSGITLKDPQLYQIAGAEDNKNIQQEKQ